MPTSKSTRRARHQQAENPTLDKGNPSASEGRVGTQQFRNIAGKGLVHLVRDETGWKEMGTSQASTNQGDKDELYQQALEIIRSEGKASTSFLQRKLQIGYNRAARIIDMMEENGIVSKANHVGKREILK